MKVLFAICFLANSLVFAGNCFRIKGSDNKAHCESIR